MVEFKHFYGYGKWWTDLRLILPAEIFDELQRIAEKQNTTVDEIIYQALKQYIEKVKT